MYKDIFLDVSKALETVEPPHVSEGFRFGGKWKDKHWMNTPGPLYCGETDNCGTGPLAAPNNVAFDKDGFEVIYRQPVYRFELPQVLEAAWADPLAGYAADGNLHWTYETVKSWWAEQRREVEQELQRPQETQLTLGDKKFEYLSVLVRWLVYLKNGMYEYLQVYAFFLDNGRIPAEGDRLPEL